MNRSLPNIMRKSILLLSCIVAVSLAGCGRSPEQRAQADYERGLELLAKNDDLGARSEFLSSVRRKSDRPEVWRALATAERRLKVTQSEFLALKRLVELDPNDTDARLRLAQIMITGGSAEAALPILEATVEDKPNAQLHALKAMAFLRTRNNAGAVQEAQRAFEIDPGNVDAVGVLAAKKLADGESDAALKLLDSLNVEPKDETSIALLKMQAYSRKGNFAQVESILRKVIALNPSNAVYQSQLIQLLISQRRFDEAEKEFRARAEATPNDSKVVLDLVRFLNLVRGPDVARNELETRIKAGGDVSDYQIALAEHYFTQNKITDAAQLLQSVIVSAGPEKKLAAQLKLAEMYVGKANVAAAEPLISEIIAKDRRNAGALKLRAAISIDKGQIDSAVSDLREALNDQPKSPELLILLATAYERGGRNELADRQYADALKSSGGNQNVVLRYVAFLQRTGDAARAEDILTEASNRSPNNTQILSSLGQVRLNRKDWAGALAVAETIGRLGGGAAVSDQIRAAALAGQNKIDESIAALEDAHRAAPNGLQPVVALASAYVRQGKADKAVVLVNEMLKKAPANAQLLVLLGQIKAAQNKRDDAVQAYKDAIARQPVDPLGYRALSELYISQKNWKEAENILQTGLKEMPTDMSLRLSYAGLQILKGDQETAIGQYEAVLKDQPNSLLAINNLVSLLTDYRSDKASLDRAILLSDALRNSTLPHFQDTYGWVLYRRGDFANAISILEGVVAKQPDIAVVHYHLGMSYAAAGQPEKAAEQLKLALALEPDGTALKESIRAAMK